MVTINVNLQCTTFYVQRFINLKCNYKHYNKVVHYIIIKMYTYVQIDVYKSLVVIHDRDV